MDLSVNDHQFLPRIFAFSCLVLFNCLKCANNLDHAMVTSRVNNIPTNCISEIHVRRFCC